MKGDSTTLTVKWECAICGHRGVVFMVPRSEPPSDVVEDVRVQHILRDKCKSYAIAVRASKSKPNEHL